VKPLLLLLLLLGAAPGEEARLEELRGQIRALDERAATAGGKEESLAGEVQRLDQLAELHRREVEILALRMEAVEERATRSSDRMDQVEAEVEGWRPALLALRDSMGRVGSVGYVGALIVHPEAESFPTAVRQAGYLAGRYRAALDAAEQRLAELRDIRGRLEASRAEFEGLQAEAEAAQRELQRSRGAKGDLLERVRQEKQEAETMRAELAAAAAQLQEMVSGLPGGAEVPAVPLRLYRGELRWPVEGKIMQEFGRMRGTSHEIPYPGMDIWAPVGTPVRAIGGGRVVFADWFQGYGKTVCVDHGEGYITVYAHSSEILVRKGQGVARGQVIALVGDTGSLKGPGLYFQLSKDGKPLDPRDWLDPKGPGAARKEAPAS